MRQAREQRVDDKPERPAPEYHVVESSSLDSLKKSVNAYLAEGWRLSGGPVLRNADQTWFQAVVRG